MKHARYSLLIGAILAAGAFAAIQINAAVAQAGEGVVPLNATDTSGDPAAAGNATITEEGLGNGTAPAGVPVPVDTTALKMHIDEANTAMQSNDTQAAMQHIILALEEVQMILGGDATRTANATDTMMGNMTMTDDMAMNSTSQMP